MPDSIDRLVADWATSAPELDLSPIEVVARIGRVRAHMLATMNAVFASHGLTDSDFATLSNLSRAGSKGRTMTMLAEDLGLTPGTVTARMDRLCSRGFAEMHVSHQDSRVRIARITAAGEAAFHRTVPAHLANERALLAPLSNIEQARLADLLRILLTAYENPPDIEPGPGTT